MFHFPLVQCRCVCVPLQARLPGYLHYLPRYLGRHPCQVQVCFLGTGPTGLPSRAVENNSIQPLTCLALHPYIPSQTSFEFTSFQHPAPRLAQKQGYYCHYHCHNPTPHPPPICRRRFTSASITFQSSPSRLDLRLQLHTLPSPPSPNHLRSCQPTEQPSILIRIALTALSPATSHLHRQSPGRVHQQSPT